MGVAGRLGGGARATVERSDSGGTLTAVARSSSAPLAAVARAFDAPLTAVPWHALGLSRCSRHGAGGEDGYYRVVRGKNHCGVANFAVHSVLTAPTASQLG